MKFCTRCFYPENHPLNVVFDKQGVCSGCRVHEEKDEVDWTSRRKKLSEILDGYKNKSGNSYDCIVPVSGAGDSYFIVDTIKREFGMNPLLVTYNKHYNTSVGHRNLAYLRTLFDCDFYQSVVSPDLVKRVTRQTLKLRASIYWHILAGQTVLPVQIAVRYKIPLIIWGVHQGVDQVGMYSHLDEVEMTRKFRQDHDLMGLEGEDLVSEKDDLPERDLEAFIYPNDKELERVGVRGIYLSNYIRWDTKAQHEKMIRRYGYETAKQFRTFDTYNNIDCVHYNGLHDYIKFLKHGYGKATDHACREIRFRRLSRSDGIQLALHYRQEEPKDMGAFLQWIDMSEHELICAIDAQRDRTVWQRGTDGNWTLLHSPERQPEGPEHANVALGVEDTCEFQLTPPRGEGRRDDDYRLIARGYVDSVPAPEFRI